MTIMLKSMCHKITFLIQMVIFRFTSFILSEILHNHVPNVHGTNWEKLDVIKQSNLPQEQQTKHLVWYKFPIAWQASLLPVTFSLHVKH